MIPQNLAERDALIESNIKLAYWAAGKAAKKFTQFDRDELQSMALLSLVSAAASFNPERGTKFATLYTTIYRNEILKNLRKKHFLTIPLSTIISDEDDSICLMDVLKSTDDTEKSVITRLILRQAIEAIETLGPRERECIRLLLQGHTQRERAKRMHTSQSYVGRVTKAAQKKLADHVNGIPKPKRARKAKTKEVTTCES